MAVTEITTESWFGRLFKSVMGVLFGLALFGASFFVLFLNEGRAVRTEKSLHEGQKLVVSVPSDRIDPSNNQRLIHVTGRATTAETLTDPEFLVAANAIKLRRRVEMYQWEEQKESKTRKKLGGGTETTTTYSYHPTWSNELIDSSGFKESGHTNPTAMPFESKTMQADHVTLGAFTLSPSLVDKMSDYAPVTIDGEKVAAKNLKLSNNALLSGDPGNPVIGDVRVTFNAVVPADISVVSKQAGTSFEPYRASAGMNIEMLKTGVRTAQQMFETALKENTILTWVLRVAGWLAMLIGTFLVLRPFSVAGDVLPFMGSMMAFGAGAFAFAIASVLSTGTIAFAWIFYRPLLGIALIAVAIAFLVWFARKGSRRVQARGAAIVPQTPSMPVVR